MKVLIDTSIWSLALRRKKTGSDAAEASILREVADLIQEFRAVIIGPIRQEILSGLSSEAQFMKLKEKLRAFEDLHIAQTDYEMAAEFYNRCRKKGIQGSQVDFLICAVSFRYNIPIYTTDNDFNYYSRHLDISLYQPRQQVH